MAADLVVPVAETVGMVPGARVQQQPRRLDRPAGHDHHLRFREVAPLLAVLRPDEGHADRSPARVGLHALGDRLRHQLAQAGREGARDHRVVGAVLGLGRAGEAHAVPAPDARLAPAVGNGVDEQRDGTGRPAEPSRAALQRRRLWARRHRRQGIAAAARKASLERSAVARGPQLPFRAFVEGLQVVVRDRPVGERAAGGDPIRRGHAEVLGQEAPRLRPVDPGASADAGGVVVVARLVRTDRALAALGIHEDPRVAVHRRARVVPVEGEALVAQVVAADLVEAERRSALQQEDAAAGLRQHGRDDATARAGAHDDRVVVRHASSRSNPVIRQETPPWLPPCAGSA